MQRKGKRPDFKELYAALLTTFKSFINGQVFLIFDALDECGQDSQRKDLLPLFHRLGDSDAKVFVTSRHYPEDIQESFCEVSKVELEAQAEDIGIYIRQKISENPRASRLVRQAKCQDKIISELTECAQGM